MVKWQLTNRLRRWTTCHVYKFPAHHIFCIDSITIFSDPLKKAALDSNRIVGAFFEPSEMMSPQGLALFTVYPKFCHPLFEPFRNEFAVLYVLQGFCERDTGVRQGCIEGQMNCRFIAPVPVAVRHAGRKDDQ